MDPQDQNFIAPNSEAGQNAPPGGEGNSNLGQQPQGKNKKLIIGLMAGGIIIIAGLAFWLLFLNRKPTKVNSTSAPPETKQNTNVVNNNINSQPTNTMNTSTPNVPSDELQIKKAILTGIINTYTVMASKNVAEIRKVFLEMAPTEQDKQQVQAASDQDLLDMAEQFSMIDTPTEDLLTNPNAQWTITADTAVIRIKNGPETTAYTAKKANGVWH